MADQRTMEELLRAATEGYAESIVVPPILAEHFKLKHSLINMMTSDQFFELEKDNPHDHIRWFNKITFTIKYKDVPNLEIKLMLFPFSLEHYKDLLRTCPHNGFIEFHQLDTFYNALNPVDQDSLNSTAGGNLLERRTQDVLMIIKNKSKDIIQGYVSARAVNYSQGNSGYRPPIVPLSELEKIKKINDVNVKAMQAQINNVKNKLRNEMKTSIQASMSNQTNELKNMMASFFQMNTASTSGSGPLPSNNIANPKGELKAIITCSCLVLNGPSVPMPPLFINSKEEERVEETLMDQELAEYTIKVPPHLVQKAKPPSQRNYVVHQRDPRHPYIPYPSRMNQEKHQEKDEIQIHKVWQMFKQLHININLADALILIPKYQKMLKALISNKEKLLELANTPLNENFIAVILKKLPEKLGDPGNFLISCGFSELTIARDVFVPVGKFTFPADFVIVDYASNPRVPLILGRPFLRTSRALIDVHGEEIILCDGDERLTLNMRHDTSSYLNQPHKESINMINIYNDSYEDYLEDFNTTSSSLHHLLKEFVDERSLITFSLGNDDLPFDIESDLREIKYLLNHDPTKEMDSILEDSVDEGNLADLNNDLVDTIPEMFTDEHTHDYSSPPLYDDVDDDLVKLDSDNDDVYDDPFDSKEDKIKESKLLIDELDPLDQVILFLPLLFNPGILIHENLDDVTVRVTPDKNVKKISISNASLILEDFNPPLYELPFHKELLGSETLLSFSSENKEKVINPGILTSKGVHNSFLP
nr:hypothetical protein [Tanacetum cinerariifolium]